MAGKREIAAHIKEAMGGQVTKEMATEIVNHFFTAIDTLAQRGEKVVVKGFGTFKMKTYRRKKGRNPQTGDDLYIPERRKLVLEVKW